MAADCTPVSIHSRRFPGLGDHHAGKYTDKQPGMGVYILVDRFKDELKREYLPEELRNLTFD